MHVNRLSALLVAALSLPLLAGCSGSNAASGIELLEQPATEADALSSGFDVGGFQPGSTRFAAHVDGLSYYLAKARTPAQSGEGADEANTGVCLVVPERETAGCGGLTVGLGFDGGKAQVVLDGEDTTALVQDGWKQVHRNLFLRGLGEAK